MACDIKENCSFFAEFGTRKSPYWKSILAIYCHGPIFKNCQRRLYHQQTSSDAPEQLLPSSDIAKEFLLLR